MPLIAFISNRMTARSPRLVWKPKSGQLKDSGAKAQTLLVLMPTVQQTFASMQSQGAWCDQRAS